MPRLSDRSIKLLAAALAIGTVSAAADVVLAGSPYGATPPGAKAEPAAAEPQAAEPVKATLLADAAAVAPGSSFTLGVRLTIKSHWHVYWQNPGETGDATRVAVTGPAGFEFGPVQWPLPTRFDTEVGVSYGYEDEVLLLVPVKVSKDAKPGPTSITADVSWLSCKESCVEGEAKLTLDVPVSAEAKPANADLFAAWRAKLPVAADAAAPEGGPAEVRQDNAADGTPAPALAARWAKPPRKVEWFPVSTPAVAIENVKVKQDGAVARIEYKPTVYKAAQVPGGRVDSVLVYEDAAGKRVGVVVPFKVAVKAP